MAETRARGRGWITACLAGGVTAMGLAPFSLGPLAFAGLMALVWIISGAPTAGRAALLGWLGGVGYFGLGLHWIVEPFFVDPAMTGWMAPFGLVGLCGGLALFWALAGWIASRLGGDVWAVALALSLVEITRGFVFTGFPWALVGHIWTGSAIVQLSAWIGPYGLTLGTLLLAALPLWGWSRLRQPAVFVALALGGPAGLLGLALWQLSGPVAEPPAQAPVLRLVQPNAQQHEKWDPARIPVFFNRMVAYSEAMPRPDLVIWPESALPMLLEDAQDALAHIAERTGAPLAIGVQRAGDHETLYYNSLVVTDGRGAVLDVYDKHHLVPFGEYMPLPGLWHALGIAALAARTESGYAPGPGPRSVDLPGVGRALVLICYEAVFARHARSPGERPDLLLQITNDAWFGAAVGPWQHLEQARMRAIEQGLPLVRVANTGVSAMIDARGRVLGQLPLNEAGYLDVALPGALPPPLYARTGDGPVFVALLLLVAAAALRRIDLLRGGA